MRGALEKPSSTEHLYLPAGGGDALARGLAEGVEANGEGVRQGAVGEALDARALGHEPPGAELVGAHRAVRGERGELLEVDDLVARAVRLAEAALRHAALDRHLPALVARRRVAAGAREASLVAAAGRLAGARAGP